MIVIHTACNEKIGVGNLSRCHTLGEEIVLRSKHDLIFICVTDLDSVQSYRVEGAENYFVENAEAAHSIIERSIDSRKQADHHHILIVDLLDLTEEDHIRYRSYGFDFLIQLNDFNVEYFRPDILINGDAFERQFDFGFPVMVLSGPEYHIIKKSVRERRPRLAWRGNRVENVLVCFGGADPAFYTEMIVEYLNETDEAHKLEEFTFRIVLGPAFSQVRIDNLLQMNENDRIQFLLNPDLGQQILKHDVVITLGGITSYEAVCLGRPVAAIEWSYMGFYVRELDKAGMLCSLGEGKKALNQLVYFLSDVQTLWKMAYSGWNMIDGLGAQRIVQYIDRL